MFDSEDAENVAIGAEEEAVIADAREPFKNAHSGGKPGDGPALTHCGVSSSNNGSVDHIENYNGGTAAYPNLIVFLQNFTYDTVNRLSSAQESNVTASSGPFPIDWSRIFNYDSFGNMWVTNATGITPPGNTPSDASNFQAGNNQLTPALAGYDAAGNELIADGYQVAYDAENRQVSVSEGSTAIGLYSYDGNGNRVMKTDGTGTTLYIYDALGQLAAEYSTGTGAASPCQTCYLHRDHLGSVRLITDPSGAVMARHDYLPFGEEIASGVPAGTTGRSDPTWDVTANINQKFTGKERDQESGLDYFGARYYGSSLGRWTSPDVLNITPDRLFNPGSALNKYIYGANNPLSVVDLDGRDVVALLEPPHGILPGHFMLFANDPTTGESGMMSFGPVDSSNSGRFFTALNGPMSSTNTYDLPATADDLRNGFAALTIQTSPEQAQAVLSFIKNISANTPDDLYRVLSTNCTTVCRDAMKAIGVMPPDAGSITPFALWSSLFQKYAKNPTYSTFSSLPYSSPSFSLMNVQNQKGVDYGNPRFGMNTFDFIMHQLRSNCTESWNPSTNTLHGCSN